jgi:hypothetical protein
MSLWDQIYPWLVSGIGGAVGAALLLLPKWGEALIQFRTGRMLEVFKSEQNRDLERLKAQQGRDLEQLRAEQGRTLEGLKAQLNHFADRGRRSNEMEFVAIQTVWNGFVKAWLSANTCVGAMIQIPDFKRMSDDDVKKLGSSLGFSAGDQETLLKSSDRREMYVRLVQWQHVNEARKDIYRARLTLREQRIFMPPELTTQFSKLIERMNSVQVERQLVLENPEAAKGLYETSQAWIQDCQSVFEDMATQANRRLFREEADTTRAQ